MAGKHRRPRGLVTGCPCGRPHRVPRRWLRATSGREVTVTARAEGRAWLVPALWVQAHGLTAVALPALAARYGWEQVPPGPR